MSTKFIEFHNTTQDSRCSKHSKRYRVFSWFHQTMPITLRLYTTITQSEMTNQCSKKIHIAGFCTIT